MQRHRRAVVRARGRRRTAASTSSTRRRTSASTSRGAGTANGTKIQLWDCNSTGAQTFVTQDAGERVRQLREHEQQQVPRRRRRTTRPTARIVQLYDCNGTNAQRWNPPSSASRPGRAAGGRATSSGGSSSSGGGPAPAAPCNPNAWVYMGSNANACDGNLGEPCGWTTTNEGQGYTCQTVSWGTGCEPGGTVCPGGGGSSGSGGEHRAAAAASTDSPRAGRSPGPTSSTGPTAPRSTRTSGRTTRAAAAGATTSSSTTRAAPRTRSSRTASSSSPRRTDGASAYSCWYGTCQYTSARLNTSGKFSQQYGRFEARIQIPEGQGVWPAFWMLGDNIGSAGWPACGEIDIMENIGSTPDTVYGTTHGPGPGSYPGDGLSGAYNAGHADRRSGFHVYATEWSAEPGRASTSTATLYWTVTPSQLPAGATWVLDQPFFILLNFAVGRELAGLAERLDVVPAADARRLRARLSARAVGPRIAVDARPLPQRCLARSRWKWRRAMPDGPRRPRRCRRCRPAPSRGTPRSNSSSTRCARLRVPEVRGEDARRAGPRRAPRRPLRSGRGAPRGRWVRVDEERHAVAEARKRSMRPLELAHVARPVVPLEPLEELVAAGAPCRRAPSRSRRRAAGCPRAGAGAAGPRSARPASR